MKHVIVSALLFVAFASTAAAQTIFVVRHAERADAASGGKMMMGADPDLSDAGRARAESLAAALKDAGITAIFTTEFKRTQQTAAPLATALGLKAETVSSKDGAGLTAKLKAARGNVLVIGHSNTVPEIIKALGVTTPVSVGDAEYDNLFIVDLGASPRLLRLHYKLP